jgi:hypothetical protein
MNIFFAIVCFIAGAILILDAIFGWRLFRWAFGTLPRWLERLLEVLTGIGFITGGVVLLVV